MRIEEKEAQSALVRPAYDPATLAKRSAGRVKALPGKLKVLPSRLKNSRILEVGCGRGECTAAAIDIFEADAYGIDPYPKWAGTEYEHLGGTRLLPIDASGPEMHSLGKFDFVHSYTVFEHIERPVEALANIFAVLKPGGRAYLVFNLHLGASAGHLRGYLPDLPWIHLTHTDEEARAIMKKRFNRDRGISWVNKLTYGDYVDHCTRIGFRILDINYDRLPIEDAYYEKHRDKLGHYSKDDLSKNFMKIVLERPYIERLRISQRLWAVLPVCRTECQRLNRQVWRKLSLWWSGQPR